MRQTSEYCALGHPDRTCDFIACYLLDRWREKDPAARVALEVQLKDRFCTVAGEVASSHAFADDEIAAFCRKAVEEVGYTAAYKARFGEGRCVCGAELEVAVHLSRQSPDIAKGVDAGGWGDQGIFWGYAENTPGTGYMPLDYHLARKVAKAVAASGIGGIDVKAMVAVEDGAPAECVVAVPLPGGAGMEEVVGLVRGIVGRDCEISVNGTGAYETHGSVGDCGTTGRKLVCDFYGGASRVGGGSPWGKDSTKADVTLNVLARRLALDYMKAGGLDAVRCSISCAIGGRTVRVCYWDGANRLLAEDVVEAAPADVARDLALSGESAAETCRRGLFGFETDDVRWYGL